MDTLDVYRAAKIFISEHGKLALNKAVERAAQLRVAGDIEGADVWLSISNAILWLQEERPVHEETRQ